LANINNQIILEIAGHALTCNLQFTLISPPLHISNIYPKEGTWGTNITLKGKFHAQNSMNSITIGGIEVKIDSFSRDSVKFLVPTNLFTLDNLIVNHVTPFEFICPDTFHLLKPVIESITPISAFGYQEITIRGKYLHYPLYPEYNNTSVLFRNIPAEISSINSTKIICRVPSALNAGPVKVTVNVRSLITVFKTDFLVKAPVISSISPSSGTFNDEITIEGENLSSTNVSATTVYFGKAYNHYSTIVSSSPEKLVVKVPTDLDSVPGKVIVHVYGSSGQSPNDFVLNPPEITAVSAPIFAPDQDIIVYGKNFNPSVYQNQLMWGQYSLKINNSTSTEIHGSIPSALPRGNYKINVIAGGYKRSYPDLYEIKSPWAAINLPASVFWETSMIFNGMGISFSVKDMGYIMDAYTANMTSYNPATNEFKDLGNHQQLSWKIGISNATINDTVYLIGGDSGLNRYDVGTNKWISLGASPSSLFNGVTLSLNGRLYHGLNYNTNNNTLDPKIWYYDFKTKSWISRSNFPGFSSSYPIAYFVIENKGYVLFADNVFCGYDPETDTWTELTPYPVPKSWYVYGQVFFVINNIGYVGLGRDNYGKNYDIIWAYNPKSNLWSESTHMPLGGRFNSVSFVTRNKAYIGLGFKSYNKLRDFYEFDPNYPLK